MTTVSTDEVPYDGGQRRSYVSVEIDVAATRCSS